MVCRWVHEGFDVDMRLLTKEELRKYEWATRENSKWHSYSEDGRIIFDEDTPPEILDSYREWKEWKTSRKHNNWWLKPASAGFFMTNCSLYGWMTATWQGSVKTLQLAYRKSLLTDPLFAWLPSDSERDERYCEYDNESAHAESFWVIVLRSDTARAVLFRLGPLGVPSSLKRGLIVKRGCVSCPFATSFCILTT